MEPKEIEIEWTRGDTLPLVFNIVDENKNEIVVGNLDNIYFTLKKSYTTQQFILQKTYQAGDIVREGNKYKLILAPEDTAILPYGKYFFDICVKSGDLTRTIALGSITLTDEATFISNM